ncbi:MAG: YihY/virulence factor BrkB family protein [Fusobacteriaceae bacterium]
MYKKLKSFKNEMLEKGEFSNIYKGVLGALKNYKRSNSNLWVSSLCYFSVLTLIPILAISFSIGRWLGIDEFLSKQLYKNSPLDESSLTFLLETAQNLLENTRNGVLAGVGFIFLGSVVISMFSLIEKALNSIWGIEQERGFFKKVSDYLSVFLTFPLMILSMSILSGSAFDLIYLSKYINIMASYVSIWVFFIIFYSVMPNTKVKLVPTIISSFFVSFLFNQSNYIFLKLQILIVAYNKIYGSFSIILIFLIWLKVIWFLILTGAHLTYILQNTQNLIESTNVRNFNFSSESKITILIAGFFVKNFKLNGRGLDKVQIGKYFNIPIFLVEKSLKKLLKLKIINQIIPLKNEENVEEENIYKLAGECGDLKIKILYSMLENYGTNYHLEKNIDSSDFEKSLSEIETLLN